MDLNGPGTSLFQGNELNNIDNLAQREEEEEAAEEQRKRDLELKSMLENAFNDFSFENDEESISNESPTFSPTSQSLCFNSSNQDCEINGVVKPNSNVSIPNSEKYCQTNFLENLNCSPKTSRNNLIMRKDFNGESDDYSEQCRKKMQNGNLHDVVDASGGGKINDDQSLHYNHCFQKSSQSTDILLNESSKNNCEDHKKIVEFPDEAYDSAQQIKILYDVRVREVHRLTELIDAMKKEHEISLNALKHQLAISKAENERYNISQVQLQNLLVSHKEKIDQLEKHIVLLESKNTELNSVNNELVNQLETKKLIITDLERKNIVLEKGSKNNSESVQYEMKIQALVEKHTFDMININNEKEKLIKTNAELEKDCAELKIKIFQLNQINDENLARKSEIISRLSRQIDETQRQYENLMKSSAAEENIRLQMELKILKEEKSVLLAKLEALEKDAAMHSEELQQYESLSKITSFGDLNDSKEFDSSEINGKLGAELYRALNWQKAKRKEMKVLQTQLDEKVDTIKLLNNKEEILKNEISELNKELNVLRFEKKNSEELMTLKDTEIATLQKLKDDVKKELEVAQNVFELEKSKLENEIKLLKDSLEIKEKTEDVNNFSEEYMKFHDLSLKRVREEIEEHYKLEILKKDLENESLKKEVEEIKNLYVEVFNMKEALLKQFEKEKNLNRSSVSGVDVDEVKRLQKELEKSRLRILELDQTVKQQYEQEVEILNLEINQLNLQVEKTKKEKDREIAEKDKMGVENELLKSEIEQVTSEKNLLLLNFEKLQKEMEEVCKGVQNLKDDKKNEIKEQKEKHEAEMQCLINKYELLIKKLKKEIELTLTKASKLESTATSPRKCYTKNIETQCSFPYPEGKSKSPKPKVFTKDTCTSPVSVFKTDNKIPKESTKNVSILTEQEPEKMSKKEVMEIMEKLGTHHESEMKILENKYKIALEKLDKKFQVEIDKAQVLIRAELEKAHSLEIQQMEERHRIELENRIEQERKEAVADLITEWACEVQSLKSAQAETKTEMERLKMKYQAAKTIALQYKTYFKSKTEHMKEEWKRIEDGYESALKELEKNVHILVDVKEDEVKAKVDTITKLYEKKINRMKEKLYKCENRLKSKKEKHGVKKKKSTESSIDFDFDYDDADGLPPSSGNSYLNSSLNIRLKSPEQS